MILLYNLDLINLNIDNLMTNISIVIHSSLRGYESLIISICYQYIKEFIVKYIKDGRWITV